MRSSICTNVTSVAAQRLAQAPTPAGAPAVPGFATAVRNSSTTEEPCKVEATGDDDTGADAGTADDNQRAGKRPRYAAYPTDCPPEWLHNAAKGRWRPGSKLL
eukprot:COSAG02_NODE_3080_length_7407_cov_63.013820_1_plen_103_part_10